MQRIARLWAEYERTVLHPDAGPIQRIETKRAFYAGVAAWLNEMTTMFDEGEEATEADLRKIQEVAEELEMFARSGKANQN